LGEGAAPKGESLSGGIAVGEGDEQVLLYFGIIDILQVCIWMSVCMCERARARVYMCVCVCVRVCSRGTPLLHGVYSSCALGARDTHTHSDTHTHTHKHTL